LNLDLNSRYGSVFLLYAIGRIYFSSVHPIKMTICTRELDFRKSLHQVSM
jgi:hypothetical protein